MVAGTDTAALVRAVGHVLTEGDDIQSVLLPEHVVGIQADGDTLVVGSDGLAEDTFLVRVADTHRELGTLGTTHHVHGVVRVRRVDVADGIQPVGPLEGAGLDVIVQRRIQDAGPVDGILAHVEGNLVLDVHVLLGIEELGHPRDVLDPIETVIRDDEPVALALLGRNEDDTVRTTCTVDGAGSRVLEDIDALDVGRVQRVDVTTRNAVDDVQRGIGTDGTHTADVHIVTRSRLAGRVHDAHTRSGGLHGTEGAGGIEFGQIVALDLHGGAGHELLLLDTITHHHHFFEKFGVFFEQDVELARSGDGEDLGPVADGGNLDAGSLLDAQHEITVKIRDRTILRAAFDDARPDDRPDRILDRTGHPDGLCHRAEAHQEQHQ